MIKNILITSAGRRVSLVKIFQETLKRYNPSGRVFVVELNPTLSAAAQIADGFESAPRVTDSRYLEFLLSFCKKNEISIVVPTIDTELHILASAKNEFLEHGILIAISSTEICETFYLKSKTEEFFNSNCFDTPKILNDLRSAKYPVFAKLDNSSCSVGAQKIESFEIALELKQKHKNYVFQEFIDGIELTVDAYFDKESKLICSVPRERLEVRAGEVSKGITRKDDRVMDAIAKLALSLHGAFGCLTIQLFKTEDRLVFIEINPRFGGGYPLSWHAGANYAEFLIKEFLGEKLAYYDKWRDKTMMLRYDAEVIVNDCSL